MHGKVKFWGEREPQSYSSSDANSQDEEGKRPVKAFILTP